MTEPLDVLEDLLDPSRLKKRARRLEVLLKAPDDGPTAGWSFFLPSCFNDAIDLKITERVRGGKRKEVWTQGANFAFKRGDVLYDRPEGYSDWRSALNHIGACVQVVEARDVSPATSEKKRAPGHVHAVLLRPDRKRGMLERVEEWRELTQDQFVRFLIQGESGLSG